MWKTVQHVKLNVVAQVFQPSCKHDTVVQTWIQLQ